MKTKRFLLPLLLAVVIVGVSAFAGFVLANGSAEKPQEPQRVQTESCIEDEPIEALIEENAEPMPFQWERSSAAMELLESGPLKTRGNEWPYEWPDYYGGAYFDEDNDIVYIYLTDMSKKPVLEKTLDEYKDCVVFLEGRISLNELISLANDIGDSLCRLDLDVAYFGTDEKNQLAIIAVSEDDYIAALDFVGRMALKNSEFVCIKPLDGKNVLLNAMPSQGDSNAASAVSTESTRSITTLYGGMKLHAFYVSGGKVYENDSSLGICGKHKGQNVFVTCGHYLKKGSLISHNGKPIGTVVQHAFYSGATGDYSIVKITNTQYKPSCLVAGTNITKIYSPSSHNAQTVRVKGFLHLNGVGVVTTSNATVPYTLNDGSNVQIKGLNVVDKRSGQVFPGESGGACINGNTFYGTVSGSRLVLDAFGNPIDSYVFYYSPVHLLTSAGFTIYPHTHNRVTRDYNNTYHKISCTLCGDYSLQRHTTTWDYSSNCCAACGHR